MKTHKSLNFYISIAIFILLSISSCTDLKEEILNEQDGSKIISDPKNANMIVASSYAVMRNMVGDKQVWGFNEVTSDEVAFPARGTDGYVPDRQALFAHKYSSTNTRIRDGWNSLLSGFSATNVSLLYLSQLPQTDEIIQYSAEVRFIRTLIMYYINDFWGQVPYREYSETNYSDYPKILTRQEALDKIISELDAIIPILKTKKDLPYGRVSKAAAQMLKAKVYLNYEIYTGTSKWDKVVSLCDDIIQSNNYKLADDYFALFSPDNATYAQGTEAILPIIFDAAKGFGGFAWPQQTLHYNQLFGTFVSLYNMGCTTGTFVDTWDQSDPRFKDNRTVSTCGFNLGFLVGQQYSITGKSLTTRLGAPLIFTKEFSIYNSLEQQGVRVVKYAPNPTDPNPGSSSNDFLLYRLADIYLMSAEAKMRKGDSAGALTMINTLRNARMVKPLTTINLNDILNERGFELYWEGHRRNDLVRFGKYCDARQEKNYVTPSYMILLPVPVSALEANKELKQNPGY